MSPLGALQIRLNVHSWALTACPLSSGITAECIFEMGGKPTVLFPSVVSPGMTSNVV
ncbi:hypothetical protein GGR39_003251 [Novosphingobium fluoreni]|uniref:Uncharacterized protein n=1 Tax=Novosphingobium fluoreni TaxID=1391222 RepID=A0A7W6C148_9SPHN|nr:hypothetical protein [Novosphingobium fluoreni]